MLNADIQRLRAIARDFHNITKIMIVFYDDDKNVICSYPDAMNKCCTELRKIPECYDKCIDCDNKGFAECDRTKQIYIYKCYMGLTEAISPICENGVIIGYILFGQICQSENKDEIRQKTAQVARLYGNKYSIDTRSIAEGIDEIKVENRDNIVSLAKILEMCACYLWLNRIINIKRDSLFIHLNGYISDNLSAELSVGDICAYLNISRTSLYHLSMEYYGCGIAQYILRRRMEKAKALLREDGLNISEVAVSSGFPDADYFSKQFKRSTGMSPSAFRRQSK